MTRLMLGLAGLVLVLFTASLVIGQAQVGPWECLSALFSDDYGPLTLVMREIRLPTTVHRAS